MVLNYSDNGILICALQQCFCQCYWYMFVFVNRTGNECWFGSVCNKVPLPIIEVVNLFTFGFSIHLVQFVLKMEVLSLILIILVYY